MRWLVLLLILAAPLSAQTYTSTSGLTAIPNNAPGIRDDIVVSGGPAAILSMRVRFSIRHPNDNDLGIWLVPPGVSVSPPYTAATMAASSAVPLSYNNGGSGDDYTDTSITGSDPCFYPTSSIWSASAPFSGLYGGGGQLTNFYGTDANGTWGLIVYDQVAGNTGNLVGWSLEFAGNGLNVFQRPLVDGNWSLRQGRDNPVMRLDLAAPSSQTVQSLTITRLGSGADSDVASVSLWVDLNHDGRIDTTFEPQLGTAQTFSGGTATFSGLGFNVNQGWASLIVMVNAAAGGAGNEFGARLSTVSSLPGSVLTSFPIDGPVAFIEAFAASFPANESFDGQLQANVSGFSAHGSVPTAPGVDTAPSMTNIYTSGRVRVLPDSFAGRAPSTAPSHVALDRGISALEFRYDLSAYSPATDAFGFQFVWASTGASSGEANGVFASDDGGATWFACLYHFPLTQGVTTAYALRTIDLSAALVHAGKSAFTAQMVVRIQCAATDSVYSRGLLIDSVSMKHATRSPRVSAGSSTTLVNGSNGVGELNFGQWDVNAGPTAALTISVKNVGSTAVSLGTPSSNSSQFVVNATGFLGTLAANATTTFTIQFDPLSLGQKTASISFTHGAADASLSPFVFGVLGEGVASPPFEVLENSVSGTLVTYGAAAAGARAFGNVDVGSASSVATVFIINVSTQVITLGTPVLAGSAPGQFVLDTTGFTANLGPAASTSFTVQFQPTSSGVKQATLNFTHNATQTGSPPSPWTCGVSGFGVTQPTITVVAGGSQTLANGAAASGLTDFGSQLVHAGQTSPVVVSLQNGGTLPLNLGTPNLTGANPSEFNLDLGAFSATVAGGGSTTFAIRFDPTFAGTIEATVSITHDGANTSSPFLFDVAGLGTIAPVLEVRESGAGGAVMTNGSVVVGPFAFGTRELAAGPTAGAVCYISNLGSDDLVIGSPAIGGGGAANFALDTTGFTTVVAPGNSTTFEVMFDPAANGAHVATVSFTHDDPSTTFSPFAFQVTGTGFTGAWLRVRQDGASGALISPGTPTAWQDFGPQDVGAGPTSAKTVWIENEGSAPLTLGAPTLNEFPGAALNLNTSGFQTTLAAGNSTSFTVQFDPALVAGYFCTVSFTHSSGGGEPSPFNIQFSGSGTTTQAHPTVGVRANTTTGTVIQNGASGTGPLHFGAWGVGTLPTPARTFHVLNNGTSTLALSVPTLAGANPGDFILDTTGFTTTVAVGSSTSFALQFLPTATGGRSALVHFAHDALNTVSPFEFTVTGDGSAIAIIQVFENTMGGPLIPNGSSTASGGRDFGFQDIHAGPTAALTVVIANVGSVNMNLGTPTFLSGGAEFTLDTTAFVNNVAPSSSTSFEIAFDPATTGAHTAHLRFTHDALPPGRGSTAVYAFIVGGHGTNGPIPMLEVHEASVPGTVVQHGSASSSYRDFGSFDINAGPTAYKSFVIVNTGAAVLTMGTPELAFVSGYNPNDFLVDTTGMAHSLQPAQSTSFSVAFDPIQVGQRTGLVRFSHNAGIAHPSPFEFEVTGTGTGTPSQPSIQLREINMNGPVVPNGGAAAGTNRDFGTLVVGGGPGAALTLVVKNWGSADLVVGVPALTGTDPGEFTLNISSYATVIAPGGTTTLTLAFDPQTIGSKSATVSIVHNAGVATPSPFTFEAIGVSLAPGGALEVRENSASGAAISNGESPTGTARDFGSMVTGSGPGGALTIHVQNTGASVFNLGTPTLVGAHAGDFLLDTSNFSAALTPGASTSFTVAFAPQSLGTKQAEVEFVHDAPNTTTPFSFGVSGSGSGTGSGGGNDADEGCTSAEDAGAMPVLVLLLCLAWLGLRAARWKAARGGNEPAVE